VSRQERPVPPPLEGNDTLITAVITAGFLLALIILLLVRNSLAPADRWWIWVAAFGSALGAFGLAYVPYLKRSRERTAERRQAEREAASYHGATDITATDHTKTPPR
jgi:membrane associated rhomboid family serine protease